MELTAEQKYLLGEAKAALIQAQKFWEARRFARGQESLREALELKTKLPRWFTDEELDQKYNWLYHRLYHRI